MKTSFVLKGLQAEGINFKKELDNLYTAKVGCILYSIKDTNGNAELKKIILDDGVTKSQEKITSRKVLIADIQAGLNAEITQNEVEKITVSIETKNAEENLINLISDGKTVTYEDKEMTIHEALSYIRREKFINKCKLNSKTVYINMTGWTYEADIPEEIRDKVVETYDKSLLRMITDRMQTIEMKIKKFNKLSYVSKEENEEFKELLVKWDAAKQKRDLLKKY